MIDTMCDPAAAAKARQRGLTVLERQAHNESIAAVKKRRHAVRVRRQSAASRRRVLAAETRMAETRREAVGDSESTRLEGGRPIQVRCSFSAAASHACRRRITGAA